MRKIFGAAVVAIGVVAAVAGCQGDTASPAPSGASGTQAPSGSQQPGATHQPGGTQQPGGSQQPGGTQQPGGNSPGTPAMAGGGKCLDPASPVVTAAVATLGRAGNEAPFLPDGASANALPDCPQLLWARYTAGGSASSPSHILFFDHTGYLGTATQRETSYAAVIGSTDTAVQVQYRWLVGDEPFCCPQGGPVTVTFTLGGGAVTPDRSIPSEVTDPFQPATGCPVDTATLVTALSGTEVETRLARPVELEDAKCANGWASARSGSHGGTTQPARVLFQYTAQAWRPVDVGSALRCAEFGAPEQLCG